jgi:hypothetical protein
MEEHFDSIGGTNLTNLDTLRSAVSEIACCSKFRDLCIVAPLAGTPLCSPYDLRLSPALPHPSCAVDLSALATLHLVRRLAFPSHLLACCRTLQ